jgi:hypothetical protein
MTLRKRLVLGVLLLLAVFVVGAAVTVVTQRCHLLDQIDDQLRTTPPPNQGRVPDEQREDSISDLYIAWIETDQTLNVLIRGQRLSDTLVTDEVLADPPVDETILTVPGEIGDSDFRMRRTNCAHHSPRFVASLTSMNKEHFESQSNWTTWSGGWESNRPA